MNSNVRSIAAVIFILGVDWLTYFMPSTKFQWLLFPFEVSIDWFVHDLSAILILLVISAWFYINVSYKNIFLKTIVLFLNLYTIKELVDLIVFYNQGTYYAFMYQTLAMICIAFWCSYKSSKWSMSIIKSDQLLDNGIYLVLDYPKTFASFIGTWFGCGAGAVKLVSKVDNSCHIFRFNTISTKLIISEFYNRESHEKIIMLPIKNPSAFRGDLMTLIGTEYNLISRNCISVYFKLFKKYGISTHPFSFIPSVFVSRLFEKDHHQDSVS